MTPPTGGRQSGQLAILLGWLGIGPLVLVVLLAVGQAGVTSARVPDSADTRSKLKIDYSPWEAAVIRPVDPAILPVIISDLAYFSESDGSVPQVSEGEFWETATALPSSALVSPTSVPAMPSDATATLPSETLSTTIPTVTQPLLLDTSPTPTLTPAPALLSPTPTRTWLPSPTQTPAPPQPTSTRTPIPTEPATCGPAFGGDGRVTTGGPPDAGWVVAIQPDGKVVVAGESSFASSPWADFTVARYHEDGGLDTSFSGDGIAYVNLAGDYDSAYGAALQSDGKIVVVGQSWNGGSGSYDFGVVRFNTDGSLDASFSGDGMVLTDIGGGQDYATAVAIQPGGKVVVVGRDWVSTDFVLVRYNADGSVDTSFGGGIVRTDIATSQDWARDVVVQPDGKIVVAGEAFYSGATAMDVAVVRLNSNGSLDTSFGGDGIVTTVLSNGYDEGEAIAVQSDGKILVAATRDYNGGNPDIALLRYRVDGSLDTSFDGDGIVITDLEGRPDSSHDLRVQPDGKIVLVGKSSNGGDLDFALLRYNADGSLDTDFGGDGIVTTAIGSGDDEGLGIALQADGKIVVAGSGQNGGDWDLAVVRYYPDGSLDDGSCPAR